MKRWIVRLALLVLADASLRAAPVTVSFEAQVDSLRDPTGAFAGRLQAGSIITGKYTFDSAQADTNSFPEVGDYQFNAAPYGVAVNVANTLVTTTPGGFFLIEVINNYDPYGDAFLLRSYQNVTSDPAVTIEYVTWQLDDPTGTALASAALPPGPPPIAKFQQSYGLDLSGPFGRDAFSIRAHVTKAVLGDSLFLPLVTVLPRSGELVDTQSFEPVVKVGVARNQEVCIERVLLDGVELHGGYLSSAKTGVLTGAEAGRTWRFKSHQLKPGSHLFEVKVRFAGGKSSWGHAQWNVTDTDEKAK